MFAHIRNALSAPHAMTVTLAAAGILMVTMGTRQSLGLFVAPINSSSEIGIVAVSLALAIGQFSWGLAQPFAGFLSDRFGPAKVLVVGLFLLALGSALTPFMLSGFGLIVSMGLLISIGSGIGGFSVLIGATAQRIPAEVRGPASGVINAGGSLGQFIGAPIFQGLIQAVGWAMASAPTARPGLSLPTRCPSRGSRARNRAGSWAGSRARSPAIPRWWAGAVPDAAACGIPAACGCPSAGCTARRR